MRSTPVVPLVVAHVVVAADVPTAALEVEAVRVDRALDLVVRERHGLALGHGVEQHDESGVDRDRCQLGSDAGCQVVGGGSAELPEAAGTFDAVEANGRRREVQRRELVGLEPGVAEVVLVLRDAVAGLRRVGARDLAEHERDAHLPQVVLVALERAPERGLLLRVAVHPARDLRGRQRLRCLQERGREVEQPLELLRRRH